MSGRRRRKSEQKAGPEKPDSLRSRDILRSTLRPVSADSSGRGGRQNRPPATAQSNATEPVPFAKSPEDDFVSVFQKFPLLSSRQRNRILAPRGEPQQASTRGLVRARHSSARQQIARAQITAIARMMGQHLRHGPVQVAKIAATQHHRSDAAFPHPDRQQRNFQPQVETTLLLIALAEKIRQWRRIAFRTRKSSRAKRSQRFHRHHPR